MSDDVETPTEPDIESKIKEAVDSRLKEIKDKLNGAYSARDEALKKVEEFEKKEKEREIERLKEEGKLKEAYELQLATAKAEKEALEQQTIALTRDIALKNILSQYEFKNPRANDMAFKELVVSLVKNDKGEWVNKENASIELHVKTFFEDEDNSFLLKPKVSSGPGLTTTSTSKSPETSLFKMSQEEVLKRAAEGTLRPKR